MSHKIEKLIGMNALPYETWAGKFWNIEPVINQLALLKTKQPDLNYEYITTKEDIDVMFILGVSEDEEQIAPFEHPIVFLDAGKRVTIACDLRLITSSTKIKKGDVTDISDVIANSDSYNFHAARVSLLYTIMVDKGAAGSLLRRNLPQAFGKMVSGMLKDGLRLTPIEVMNLETFCSFYFYIKIEQTLGYKDNDRDEVIDSLHNDQKGMRMTVSGLKLLLKDVMHMKFETLDDFVDGIKTIIDNPKSKGLKTINLHDFVNRYWYGPTPQDSLVMSMESPVVFAGIYYSTVTSRGINKSTLTNVFNGNKNLLKTTEFVKKFDLLVEDVLEVEFLKK